MNLLSNLDLLSVGIAIAGTLVLGFTVYFNNRNNVSNKLFLLFTIVTSIWGILNYLSYQIQSDIGTLWSLRFVLFFAIWQAYTLFLFLKHFPDESFLPNTKKRSIFGSFVVLVISLLTLTPIMFYDLQRDISQTQIATPETKPGIALFGITAISLVIAGIFYFFKKINKVSLVQKKQFEIVGIGVILMFCSIIIFNFILPVVFKNIYFIPFGALFTLPFVLFTSYAILKHRLFNVKVVATAILIFLLATVLFLEIIFADSVTLIIFRSSIFFLVLVFGINLIRSVVKEVKQREQLEIMTGQLEAANESLQNLMKQRESLVHLITHKVKGSFTHSKYIFAGMLDGTFGAITPELKKWAEQGLESDNVGINTVDLVLNVANMQKGLIKYNMQRTDFKDLVFKSFSEKKVPAEKKGLKIEKDVKDGDYYVMGDSFWLKEAVSNLFENSIRYTREGQIDILLNKLNDKIILSVKDTGIGIKEEDKKNLFTEGGRGQDSVRVNVDSTGYGLYTVKLIIEAHKGRVWVESEGEGRGSTFFIELDAV